MDDEVGRRIEERLFREEVHRRVRGLASDGKILWGDHALDRIEERGIDILVAKRVLERGDLKNDVVEPGRRPGEWKVTIVDRVSTNRDVGVVTVVVGDKHLRVITVEWEDL